MGFIESDWFLPKWLIGDHPIGWFTSITPISKIDFFMGKNFEIITAVMADDADEDGISCGSLKYIMIRVQVKPKLPEARTAHNLSEEC